MPDKNQRFYGTWVRTAAPAGGDSYPDRIEFKKNGLYFGKKEQTDTFTCWDVGTFEVLGEKQVKISTANDALITYQFTLSKDTLRFGDPEGHQLDYRRLAGS